MGLLILNVDYLPCHLLGPYGNSSVPTPTLNSWAAHGLTFDSVFRVGSAVQPAPETLLNFKENADLCLTFANNPFREPDTLGDSVIAEVLESGLPENVVRIPLKPNSTAAITWEQSAVAKYLERALSHWSQTSLAPNSTVWLDVPLFGSTWDAPLEWRRYLSGDDDPELFLGTEPPFLSLPAGNLGGLHDITSGFDPDLRMGYENAAGAMVMLLDQVLEWLRACVASFPQGNRTIVLLTAESGYSLGEHGKIGGFPDVVWSEQAHLPLIMFFGPDFPYPVRIPGVLSQTAVLSRLLNTTHQNVTDPVNYEEWVQRLADEFGALDYSMFSTEQPRAVVTQSSNQLAVRTNAWSFVWRIGHAPQLFVRPDDRFEQNDIASRCPQIVETFQWYLPDLLHHFGQEAPELSPHFAEMWRESCRNLITDGRSPGNLEASNAASSAAVAADPADLLSNLDINRPMVAEAGQLPKELWTNGG